MNLSKAAARTALSRIGLAMLLFDVCFYFVGCTHLQLMISDNQPLQQTLSAGARYCVAGGAVAVLAIPFLLFAKGWKRVPLIAGSLVLIPLFIGFTLY